MKGKILSYRMGRHTQTNNHMVVDFNMASKEKAKSLVNKKVKWKSQTGKIINGTIASAHGNSGKVRVIFERGLPGQAVGSEVEIWQA